MVESIIGLIASGVAVLLWWLQNRAATKKEKKEQSAADLHEKTSDIIDGELGGD
jgi:cell division protein FtsX